MQSALLAKNTKNTKNARSTKNAIKNNRNGGQRMTLHAGKKVVCTTLRPGQLYGIFAYNSAPVDNNTELELSIVWSDSEPPATITVPGTANKVGRASMGFVSGTDTQTVSISLSQSASMAQVDVWIGSVSLSTGR